ncbi:hypothetical protein C7M84_023965 [Penaeus vannamei]|uniref:Uncharacterized protein n=1 Tax=Penaeus vannamei TaxID=6689 RepID=A0A423U2B3_PENVA|nr:hypothetical protein C7M84_023965 [Penaeus vannamei]
MNLYFFPRSPRQNSWERPSKLTGSLPPPPTPPLLRPPSPTPSLIFFAGSLSSFHPPLSPFPPFYSSPSSLMVLPILSRFLPVILRLAPLFFSSVSSGFSSSFSFSFLSSSSFLSFSFLILLVIIIFLASFSTNALLPSLPSETRGKAVARQFSSLSFPSLEAALLSLAFLTFAVFLIDLVQDVLSTNSTSTGRHTRNVRDPEEDQRTTDLIVLALTSLDTVSHGRENPECGQKLLCHLNRSGWHDEGILGTALFLTLFSPESGFQRNMDAAQYGRDKQECVDKYTSCPSILGDLIYHR